MDLTTKKSTVNPAFNLSARQEQLLFAALNSNAKPTTTEGSPDQAKGIFTMAPSAFSESPVQAAPGSGSLDAFQESPFIDYDYEFDGADGFEYDFSNDSQAQMIGKLPGTSSDGDAEVHDKRSHPDDDGVEEEGGGKRREGDEKSSKKPGRKPLTSEPTSKRKAQNRAAQRAFRERKEKHLKDLETKVEDLQKASESANHENSILRAQIDKMSTELREYKKRASLGGGLARSTSLNSNYPAYLSGKGFGGGLSTPNDVNFSFEFPKFGRLPGPSVPAVNGTRQSASPTTQTMVSPVERDTSPRNQSLQFSSPTANGSSVVALTGATTGIDNGDMSSLSGLFSPSLLDSVGKNPYDFSFGNNGTNGTNITNGSRSSTESANGNASTGHNTSYSSPSASSNSNHGANSSCGTSPEPTMQSPVYNKPVDSSLTTIGEESCGAGLAAGEVTFCDKLNMACGNPNNPIPRTLSEVTNPGINETAPAFDINGIDWFAQQNDNQFDPQLFGDYREPQDNILSGDTFGNSFFSDAFAGPDFTTPFNIAPSPQPAKNDLIAQIDQQKENDDEVVPAEDTSKLLSCNTIWDRLQACPNVKAGEFDLDTLCQDLQKKAKCSEKGAVVKESDFIQVMSNHANGDKRNKA